MNAEEFMRDHAMKASSGRIPEVLGDLTPEAMSQLAPLMAGGPNPMTGNSVSVVSSNGDDHLFDVTYTGDDGKSLTMRETVRQMVAYLNAHNVAGMLSCFDEEMEWLDVPMEASYRGKAEISVFLDSLFDAFPDLDYQLTRMVTRGA